MFSNLKFNVNAIIKLKYKTTFMINCMCILYQNFWEHLLVSILSTSPVEYLNIQYQGGSLPFLLHQTNPLSSSFLLKSLYRFSLCITCRFCNFQSEKIDFGNSSLHNQSSTKKIAVIEGCSSGQSTEGTMSNGEKKHLGLSNNPNTEEHEQKPGSPIHGEKPDDKFETRKTC